MKRAVLLLRCPLCFNQTTFQPEKHASEMFIYRFTDWHKLGSIQQVLRYSRSMSRTSRGFVHCWLKGRVKLIATSLHSTWDVGALNSLLLQTAFNRNPVIVQCFLINWTALLQQSFTATAQENISLHM